MVKAALSSMATWLGLRLLNRPLRHLLSLAAGLEPSKAPLPGELAHLAATLTHLHQQVRVLTEQRVSVLPQEADQTLSTLFHRLRTPLTRLRLRVERVDDPALKETLRQDLRAISELLDDSQAALHGACVTPDTNRTNPQHTAGQA